MQRREYLEYREKIAKLARKFESDRCEREDLIHAGMVGLIEARNRFDSEQAENLWIYAYPWVRAELCKCRTNSEWHFNVPQQIARAAVLCRRIRAMLRRCTWLKPAEIQDAVSVRYATVALKLSDRARIALEQEKAKLARLAHHSKTSYRELATRAFELINQQVVPIHSLIPERASSVPGHRSPFDEASDSEVRSLLRALLPKREQTILSLRAQGYEWKEVAARLADFGNAMSVRGAQVALGQSLARMRKTLSRKRLMGEGNYISAITMCPTVGTHTRNTDE